jgi:hypothetical protein
MGSTSVQSSSYSSIAATNPFKNHVNFRHSESVWEKTKRNAQMFSFLMCLIGLGANAQAAEFSSDGDYSKGAAYVQIDSVLLANSFHAKGEYRFLPGLAVSGGVGYTALNVGLFRGTALGGQFQIHAISGKNKGHFEFALGAGYYKVTLTEQISGTEQSGEDSELAIPYFLGYRLQPPDGGLLFRIGLGSINPTPVPGLSSSFGWSF